MSSDKEMDRNLARAACRAALGPAPLLAGLINIWRQAFPLSDLREALACSERSLSELALCRRPRSAHWIEDTKEIAVGLELELDRLIGFVRAAEAIERFGSAHSPDEVQAGLLLAARDFEED
jgi:hypothetical protein